MSDNTPISDNRLIEIHKEQLRMFKEQMQKKDVELMEIVNARTQIALKIQVTEGSIKLLENRLTGNISPVVANDKPQFTREWVRGYMKWRKLWVQQPAQTKEIVDKFYNNASEEEKEKAIKILSVVFNTLIKSNEISVEKKEGIKGNFYVWNGDV